MRLKRYRDAVRIATEDFQPISLQVVPREHNQAADALAFFNSIFDPDNEVQDAHKVQVIFCPFVPDNFDNWEVFHDDKQIRRFMANVGSMWVTELIGERKDPLKNLSITLFQSKGYFLKGSLIEMTGEN